MQEVLKDRSGQTCQVVFMPTTGLMLCWGTHRELQWRRWSWAVCIAESGSWVHLLLHYESGTQLILTSYRSARPRSCGNQRASWSCSWGSEVLFFFFFFLFLYSKENINGTKIIFRLRWLRGVQPPGSAARHLSTLSGPMGMTPSPYPDVPLSELEDLHFTLVEDCR